MKRKNRILAMLLCLAMIFSVFSAQVFAEETDVPELQTEEPSYPEDGVVGEGSYTVDARYWLYEDTPPAPLLSGAVSLRGTLATTTANSTSATTYNRTSGYGGQLTSVQKKIYNALVAKYVKSSGLCASDTSALVYTPEKGTLFNTTLFEELNYAFFAFIYDYPQVFWVGGYSASWGYDSDGSITSVTITMTEAYAGAKSDISKFNNAVTSAASSIKSSLSGTTVYQYYEAVHNWMCGRMSYNYDALDDPDSYPRAHSAAGLFAGDGCVVCQGYGEAFKILCDYLRKTESINLYTALVIGTADEDSSHMWNYAYMPDGKWYAVDVCWDDQDSGIRDTYFLCGKNSQGFHDKYVNERTEKNTFDPEGSVQFTYPSLSSAAYEGKVKITTQPKSVTVAKAGDTATVKVVASGEGLSYAWYYKDTTMSSFKKGSIETASYSIAVTAARNGRQLYCVVTGKDGYTARSNTVTISIASAIVITKQPADVTVAKAGDTAKVPITATGTSLKYTWYVKDPGASSFSKSSVTSSTYSFSVTAVKSGRQVYCVVSDANGGSVKSNTATVKIAETLKITKQPADVAVAKAGTTANVPITATGTGLKYTWYVKDPGATSFSKSSITSSTYSFSVTEAKNGRQIYCIVSDTAGNSMKSSTATVTICAKITTQPKSVTVSKEGDTATVKVTASGDGLKYEWWYKNSGMTAFKKGSITTATYSVAVTSARNGRQLYCKISDKYGNSVTTNIVTIKVG